MVAETPAQAQDPFEVLDRLADKLTQQSRQDDARETLDGVVCLALEHNRPLEAIFAARRIHELPADASEHLGRIAGAYCAESTRLVSGLVPEPVPAFAHFQPNVPPNDDPQSEAEPDDTEASAVETEGDNDGPSVDALLAALKNVELGAPALTVSPVPLLSDLNVEDFQHAVALLDVRLLVAGDALIEYGEPLPGMWWLVHGEFEVSTPDGPTFEASVLSLIGLEALFGEDARITVRATSNARALFLPRSRIRDLMSGRTKLRESVRRVVSRYEVHRAVAQCQALRELPTERHIRLFGQCQGFRVPTGEQLFGHGAKTPGVYLITHGTVELRLPEADDALMTLSPGDVVGTQGIDEPALSTAVASSSSRVLFIPRDSLGEIAERHADVDQLLKSLERERRDALSP